MLTGANGTHSVLCVCAAHQNVRLVHEGYNVTKLMTNQNTRHYTYHDCVTMMMCSAPQQFFFLQECTECPTSHNLQDVLGKLLEENAVEHVAFRQWISMDA